MRLLIVTVLWYLLVAIADARIGETSIQFVDRYGAPTDSSLTKISDSQSPLIEGAIHHTYEYQGWKIRAAFLQLDGPAVRMDYQKIITAGVSPQIQDYELQAIMAANTPPGTSWKPKMYRQPEFAQQRTREIWRSLHRERHWRENVAAKGRRYHLVAQPPDRPRGASRGAGLRRAATGRKKSESASIGPELLNCSEPRSKSCRR